MLLQANVPFVQKLLCFCHFCKQITANTSSIAARLGALCDANIPPTNFSKWDKDVTDDANYAADETNDENVTDDENDK